MADPIVELAGRWRRTQVNTTFVEQDDRLSVVSRVAIEDRAAHANGCRGNVDLVGGLGTRSRDEAEGTFDPANRDRAYTSAVDEFVQHDTSRRADGKLGLVEQLKFGARRRVCHHDLVLKDL